MAQRNGKLEKNSVNINYLLHLPHSLEKNREYPLILFLHGVAQRGNDSELLKLGALPQFLETQADFPFIVISPQCPDHSYWGMESESVIALLDEMISVYPVDHTRVYLTGISMGGYGAWELAIKYPERFAALAPLCGGGEPEQADVLKNVPIWTFHGAKDDIVPLQNTLHMVEALERCGGNVKLTVYPDTGHDLTETYSNPMLYDWFLLHQTL